MQGTGLRDDVQERISVDFGSYISAMKNVHGSEEVLTEIEFSPLNVLCSTFIVVE